MQGNKSAHEEDKQEELEESSVDDLERQYQSIVSSPSS